MRWIQGHTGWCKVGVGYFGQELFRQVDRVTRVSTSVTLSLLAYDWSSEHRDGAPRFPSFRLEVECFRAIPDVVLNSFIEA